jgi:hypothetical protein
MSAQMKKVQKRENRTRSELLREAWRQYFERHYGSYTPTKAELLASVRAAPRSAEANTERSRNFFMTWTIHIAKRAEKQPANPNLDDLRLLLLSTTPPAVRPIQ